MTDNPKEYTKVADIPEDEYKTVIKYAIFEDHNGECRVLTEKTKLPPTFGEKIDKASVVYGCFGVALAELVPQALTTAMEEEEAVNAELRKKNGKPKLEIVK